MSDVILLDKEFKDLNTKGMLGSLMAGAGKYLYFRDIGHGYRVVKKLTGQDNQGAYVKVPATLFMESGYFRETLTTKGVTQDVVKTFINELKKDVKMENVINTAAPETVVNDTTAEVVVDQVVADLPKISEEADELLKADRNKLMAIGTLAALGTSVAHSFIGGHSLVKAGIAATISVVGGAAVGYGVHKTELEGMPSYITALGFGSTVGSIVNMGANFIAPNANKEIVDENIEYSIMPEQGELPVI